MIEPRRIDLDAVLNAHAFMRVERPPELWEVDVLDEPFIRMLGELIVVGLLHHDVLADLTVNASNVTTPEPPQDVPPGDYVAITVAGPGAWEHDRAWTPSSPEPFWSRDVDAAIRAASVVFAYVRTLGDDGGSITVWIPGPFPSIRPMPRDLAPSRSLSWRRVAAWRASRHHLDERVSRRRRLAVASDLCGLHAQVLSSAELSLWARVDGLRRSDLSNDLWRDRTLVKMWAMRGTLHLFRSDEHPLWRSALSSFAHVPQRSWERYFGVTSGEIERLLDTIASALDGQQLTRQELAVAVAERHPAPAIREALLHSWGGILKPASYRGVLCFAPGDGQRVRFTNPRSWLRLDGGRPTPDEATREVIRRFLATYGPTSREELARWWGAFSASRAEQLVRSLDDEVAPVDVEGIPMWALARHVRRIRAIEPARSVRLLPGFDPYVIGSTRHSIELMPGDFRARVHRQAGWVSPVLAVDGMLEGVWTWSRKGARVVVAIEPFRTQPRWVRRGAEAEAERLASFLSAELDLTWS